MKQINCPIDFNKITKEYKTTDLTIIYSEKKREGFNGFCTNNKINSERKYKGKWLEYPFISLVIGKNSYPYTTKDRYNVEFTANTKEELILFLFWHEFQHYLDNKVKNKTKHSEISMIAYNRVWGDKK
jgi:hypothetical protein